MEELVSVIIPTHNRVAMLERAVNSALAQTWRHIEVIVVDDASTDGTAAYLARAAAADMRVKAITNGVAKGGAEARNQGIGVARGIFIAFLDDDDWWEPVKVERQAVLLRTTPSASAATSDFLVHGARGTEIIAIPPNLSLNDLLKANLAGGASVCMARKTTLEEFGGFDPRLTSGQDWQLWVNLRQRGPIVKDADPLVHYAAHHGERITSGMEKKYVARRRFYLKFRCLMGRDLRRYHLAWTRYYRCWRLNRSRSERIAGLVKAVSIAISLGEFRLAVGIIKNGLAPALRR